jgi:hypothetical protein
MPGVSIEVAAAWSCFRERNARCVILSSGQEASRRVTEDLVAERSSHDLTRDSVSDGFSTRIGFKNGSEIVSLPASQRAVRGLGKGVKLLVVDQAGFVPNEFEDAPPTAGERCVARLAGEIDPGVALVGGWLSTTGWPVRSRLAPSAYGIGRALRLHCEPVNLRALAPRLLARARRRETAGRRCRPPRTGDGRDRAGR